MPPSDGEHLAHGASTVRSTRPGEGSRQPRQGCVEIVCGSMFSGKTEELLRRIKRARLARQRTQLFKPRVDDRYDAVKVVTHEGVNADALPVASAEELLASVLDETAVVGVDEVQFFDATILGTLE